ncbi:MAG: OB-fold domain-containing protein, partial [Betaproteobacteria bacterium]|nr:OB-fold domain-containing protein [Betaproteobacteria bacterium]
CGCADLEWQLMSGNGRIVSWSTFERDYYAGQFPMPWTNLLVELEEGPWFLSEPHRLAAQDIEFGMPVRLVFLQCEDSSGPFALPVFAPSGEEQEQLR